MNAEAPTRVVMLSLHTSPLAQAGTGDAGGLNVYVNALSRALAAQGIPVDLVTTDVEGPQAAGGCTAEPRMTVLPDGRRLHVLGVPASCRQDKNRLLECLADLAERVLHSLAAADSRPIGVVHSHYWISGLAGLQIAEALNAPLVHTMHTIGAVKKERDPAASEHPRRDHAEAQLANRAAVLTANTRREAADLQRLFCVDAARIHLVKPGVDLSIFHPPTGLDRRRGELGDRPLRLSFAGRLQTHKGPQVAVAAVSHLHRHHPEVPIQLTVAGRQSGPEALDIAGAAREAGIADVVVLTDPMPQNELAELFRSSDAVLVPSYSESFGLVALEAMACGTPVIAHRVGGLAELVQHGRTGRLVDSLEPRQWASQLEWLINGRDSWDAHSAAAAELAAGFSWTRTAQASVQAYRAAAPVVAVG